MKKIRNLLRIKLNEGLSKPQASKAFGIGKTTSITYISSFHQNSFSLRDLDQLGDNELIHAITPIQKDGNEHCNLFTS